MSANSRQGWRWSTAISEYWYNVGVRPLASLAVLLVVAASAAGVSEAEIRELGRIREEVKNELARGRDVWVVEGADPDRPSVSGHRCLGLQALDAVSLSGYERATGTVDLGITYGRVQTVQVSHGALAIWTAPPVDLATDKPVVYVGEVFAGERGLESGSQLLMPDGIKASVVVFNPTFRYPRAARWLAFIADPDSSIDRCWAEFTAGAATFGEDVLRAWFDTGDGARISLRRVYSSAELTPFVDQVARRVPRFVAPSLGLILGLALSLVGQYRRQEGALYMLTGMSLTQLRMIDIGGMAVISSFATALGALASLSFSVLLRGDVDEEIFSIATRSSFEMAFAMLSLYTVAVLTYRPKSLLTILKS